jgi:molecular chaperone GrpE
VSRKSNGHEHDELAGPAAATEDSAGEAGLTPSGPEATPADTERELRAEIAELQQTLLRRRADFENYRKRVERDRGTAAVDAEVSLLTQFLGTVDNLERALAAQEAGPALRQGVVLTHRELLALLKSLGVEKVDPLGQRFDPAEHQAMLHEPVKGFEPGTIAEVYRKGFRYRDRLLRPALVKVAGEHDTGAEGGEVQ